MVGNFILSTKQTTTSHLNELKKNPQHMPMEIQVLSWEPFIDV